jgi:hypothetical protein
MTDRSPDRIPSGERGSRGVLGPIWVAAAIFLALLALLATRVVSGQDPALRARAAVAPAPVRRLLIRRVYERRVIVHLPPSASAQPTQASQQVSSARGSAPSPPVTRSS